MIEKRSLRPAGNGSEEITSDSPLPLKLAELERRISAVLTEPRSASDLADLLQQTDYAIIAASEHAKLENEKSLDPLQSPDPHAARQAAEDATFLANRLRTLQPRLLARYQEVVVQERCKIICPSGLNSHPSVTRSNRS